MLQCYRVLGSNGVRCMQSASMKPPVSVRTFALRTSAALQSRGRLPMVSEAQQLPLGMCHLSNEVLYFLAEDGNYAACKERLIRNVMSVDTVEWSEANKKVTAIEEVNR